METRFRLVLISTVFALACNALTPSAAPTADTATAPTPPPAPAEAATDIPATQTALPIQTDCAEPLCLSGSLSLLELQNRTVDENVLKLFSVAVDSTRNLVYVAGIMTSDIGIMDGADETWVGTLDAGFSSRAIKYIYLDSTANYLYVLDSSNSELRRVDVENGQIVGPIPLPDGGFGQFAAVDETRTRFYLATTRGLTAFDGNTLKLLYTVDGLGDDVGPMVYDQAADRFYMLDSTNKDAERTIHIIDGESGQAAGEIQYFAAQGGRSRWLNYDPFDNKFFIGMDRAILIIDMNGNEIGAISLPGNQPVEDLLFDPASDQVFVFSMERPQDGQVAAIGGHMDVYDLSGQLRFSFNFGRKPHHMTLNSANGHIYIPNGDASVIWSIDTRSPHQAVPLRLGDSVEQIVVSGDGSTLYLASRLGGSYIGRYELDSGTFEAFTAGTWPIPLRRDSSGQHLFALNAWDSSLSFYSLSPQQTLLGTIPLGIPAGSTDRLPDLVIDSAHSLAYVAYPEFGMVAVVDWANLTPVTTLSIEGAETGDTGGGPGQLQVAVNESANRLFVYEPKARRLFIYDAANNYALLGGVDLREQSRSIGQADADLFFFDPQQGALFLGALELDGITAQPTGRALSAGNKIFGMDSNANLYWAVDESNNTLLAIDRATLATRHSQPLPENAESLPTLAYDPTRRQLYVGYLTTAKVYVFTVGQIP